MLHVDINLLFCYFVILFCTCIKIKHHMRIHMMLIVLKESYWNVSGYCSTNVQSEYTAYIIEFRWGRLQLQCLVNLADELMNRIIMHACTHEIIQITK